MDNFIFFIFIVGSLFIFITILIGIWSILIKREKKYSKMIEEFQAQKDMIEKSIKKGRKNI